MSAVAHFFVAVSGSFIHERMAQLFIDIYTKTLLRVAGNKRKLAGILRALVRR